jgi:hypothetical protein
VGIRLVYRGRGLEFRIALLAFLAAVGCIASSALLLMVLPNPHTRAHYLVAGTAPTVAGLIVLLARTHRERARMDTLGVRRTRPGTPA